MAITADLTWERMAKAYYLTIVDGIRYVIDQRDGLWWIYANGKQLHYRNTLRAAKAFVVREVTQTERSQHVETSN